MLLFIIHNRKKKFNYGECASPYSRYKFILIKCMEFCSVDGPRGKLPRPRPSLATWPEAIMACDDLRVVLVVSEWPQARPASGHTRPPMPGHGLRLGRRPGACGPS
jgi:hypothetical protein